MNAKIGVVGLGVMGHMLALNMERNGFAVAGLTATLTEQKHFWMVPPRGKM